MDQILGHAGTVATFQAALASGRLHHAWIFQGPNGVGKFTAACVLGKLLLCHDPQAGLTGELSACDGCESCRLFDAESHDVSASKDSNSPEAMNYVMGGIHPDFHIITKELARFSDDAAVRKRKLMNIPADVLREYLIQPVSQVAQLRHGKVFVVDEAELLDLTGQNILLKTLEEPPAGTHIILVTSKPDRLLPTVQSRCQQLVFGPVPDELMLRWVDDRLGELSAADREWVLSFADGSPGRVLMARRFDLFAWYRQVLPGVDEAVQARPRAELGAVMAKLIDDLAKAWVEQHTNASKEAANKMASELMFTMIAQHARRALVHVSQRQSEQERADPGEAEAALQPWLNVIDALNQAQSELAANVNLALVMDHLASMIARPWRVPVVATAG
jgi:hypothetical protein